MSECAKCDGDGYVCENCHEPEVRCECEDELDLDDGDELPELRRCRCNPYMPVARAAATEGPSPVSGARS